MVNYLFISKSKGHKIRIGKLNKKEKIMHKRGGQSGLGHSFHLRGSLACLEEGDHGAG